MPKLNLYSSADELSPRGAPAFRQFGGVKVFSTSQKELDAAIARVRELVEQVCVGSWGLTPSMTQYLVQQEIGAEIPRRAFNAILGSQLRCGNLVCVLGEGSQGTPFRVILHPERAKDFRCRVRQTAELLPDRRTVQIAEIRDKYFAGKPKGSWTQSMYVAARLVRLGIAEYRDQYTVVMPDIVANALKHINKPFHDLDA